MLEIYLTDLAAYNKGYLIGEWVSLPCDSLEEKLKEILKKGSSLCFFEDGYYEEHEEFFITDYEWEEIELFKIGEYENIFQLNEQLSNYSFDSEELKKISFLIDQGFTFEESISKIEEVIFYENMSLESVAMDLVEEGCFGVVPKSLESYINYEKIGRDLSYDGYIETNEGVYYVQN